MAHGAIYYDIFSIDWIWIEHVLALNLWFEYVWITFLPPQKRKTGQTSAGFEETDAAAKLLLAETLELLQNGCQVFDKAWSILRWLVAKPMMSHSSLKMQQSMIHIEENPEENNVDVMNLFIFFTFLCKQPRWQRVQWCLQDLLA